ncbi:MAG: exodeoxyribonuclease III [Alphaproteobacteria bacterium]
MVKISCWNVNSVRTRLSHLLSWLESDKADIVLLQELKCTNELFPKEAIEDLGYNVVVHGQKSYNGVAILSRYPIEEINIDLTNDPDHSHSRYIEVVITVNKKVIRVASVYVPNGQEVGSDKFKYKLAYFDALYDHFNYLLSLDEVLIIGGDFNVAPNAIDVYDETTLEGSICFHELERKKFAALLHLGFIDAYREAYPKTQEFTWWDYRAGAFSRNQGMRIDHILLSPQAADLFNSIKIEKNIRNQEKPSDHAPITCVLNI